MKKVFAFALALLMLSLCACGKTPEPSPDLPDRGDPPVTEQTEPVEEETEDTTPVEEEPIPTETEPAPTEAPVGVLDTKYYTLTLPDSWIGKCVCDIHERDNGSYSMSVHESQAFFEFGGGTLFTLMMLPTEEDYTIFPSYELLCALDTPDGTFNIVALFPTDVQFTEASADAYTEMSENVMDVLYTIAPKDGIEMAMP